MEDARFVRFTDDDGEVTYYATYTAFDGFEIMPQLIQTNDFASFRISTLNGPAAQNKGMALFPRRIGGKYVMLSRRDRENLHLATSTDVRHWADVTELHRPEPSVGAAADRQLRLAPRDRRRAGWSSPTASDRCGATCSARCCSTSTIPGASSASCASPCSRPTASEREGYVPNVVYSCGVDAQRARPRAAVRDVRRRRGHRRRLRPRAAGHFASAAELEGNHAPFRGTGASYSVA